MRRPAGIGALGAAALLLLDCNTEPSTALAGCAPSESSASAVLPLFDRPFDGTAPVGNDFDHDLPVAGDANGHVLTLCGVRDGTPLRAVADGDVFFAGLEPLRPCPALGRFGAGAADRADARFAVGRASG